MWGAIKGVRLIVLRLLICKPPYGGNMNVPTKLSEYRMLVETRGRLHLKLLELPEEITLGDDEELTASIAKSRQMRD